MAAVWMFYYWRTTKNKFWDICMPIAVGRTRVTARIVSDCEQFDICI